MGSIIQRWTLAIGIAIIFNLFINYGIATFQPSPEYNDFCDNKRPHAVPVFHGSEKECAQIITPKEMQEECGERKGYITYDYNGTACPVMPYCETCQHAFDEARKGYNSNVFIILIVLGAAAIAAGTFLKVEAVGTGFLLAGILSVIIGTLRAWDQLQDIMRFALLGVVLAVLIWLGYKKVK